MAKVEGTRRRRSLAALVLAALVVTIAGIGGVGPISSPVSANAPATPSPPTQHPAGVPYTVSAFPTVNVVDGQSVTVTVKSPASYPVYGIEIQLCRSAITYGSHGYQSLPPDFREGGANCPAKQISSNGDHLFVDSAQAVQNAMTPAGESVVFHVGQGSTTWTADDGSSQKLTCDIGVVCSLVVEVLAGVDAGVEWDPWTFAIDFRDSNPLNSCGGPADGIVRTAGSDRMQDAYIDWAVDLCSRAGQHGAATSTSFQGEGDAMKSFSAGTMDIAYSGLGYHGAADLAPVDPTLPNGGRRNSIAIPMALNAAVVASGNGETVQGKKVPYTKLRFTTNELAAMFAEGQYGLTPYVNDIAARNPDMHNVFSQAFGQMPAVSAKSEASSWLASRYFSRLAPAQWIVGGLGDLRSQWGQARSVDANFALADPTFNGILRTMSDVRGTVRKTLVSQTQDDTGGAWVLTDLATARALDLTPVELTNAAGAFVAPDSASMLAAVHTMTPDEFGVLVPDPNMSAPAAPAAAAAPVVPYPMTFVEYAIVPAEPLLNPDCSPRTASQALLETWLDYIVGDGQKALPAGMEPLPPDLVKQAHDLIGKVGRSASTAVCPVAPPTTDTTVAPPDVTVDNSSFGSPDLSSDGATSTDGASSTAGAGNVSAAAPVAGATTAGVTPPAASPVTTPTTLPAAAGVPVETAMVPAFAGSRGPNGFAALVAFLVILALVSGAAYASSGRLGASRSPSATRGGGTR